MEQNKTIRENNKAAFDAKLAKEQTKTLEAKSLAKKFEDELEQIQNNRDSDTSRTSNSDVESKLIKRIEELEKKLDESSALLRDAKEQAGKQSIVLDQIQAQADQSKLQLERSQNDISDYKKQVKSLK